jgi:hypothetical protein
MKYMKRAGIYQASNYNVTFNPKTFEAYSYKWWRFVALVEGKVIFNNYRYSNSTSKHQSKVRGLLNDLGIKIDIEMPLPKGISDNSLAFLIQWGEETLCDQFLTEQIKKQERYQRAKSRKLKAKLEDYLENQVHFRDYEIKERVQFGRINTVAVHQCVDAESLEQDVQNALHSFHRDGFSRIVFYIGAV